MDVLMDDWMMVSVGRKKGVGVSSPINRSLD